MEELGNHIAQATGAAASVRLGELTKMPIKMDKTGQPKHSMLPVRAKDQDFPLSWIRTEGKGRVFYYGLAHGPAIFSNPAMVEHILAGIQYALGDLKADATPSAAVGQK